MPRGPVYKAAHLAESDRVTDPAKFDQVRQRAEYTYRELAEELGLPKSTLHNIAKGHTMVAPAFARRVENLLKVPAGTLFASAVSTTADTSSQDTDTIREASTDKPDGTASSAIGNQ